MKKLLFILALSTVLFSCKKTENENPKPDFDASAWANVGNNIFNNGGFPLPDSIPVTDSTVHPVGVNTPK